jgi:IMP dehydrogenase/GMP reductase
MLKYDFNDVLIKGKVSSEISSRSEINPYYLDNRLPLITAPMDTVINEDNLTKFSGVKITPCLPRNTYITGHISGFKSISLSDVVYFLNNDLFEINQPILIDIANGHMQELEYAVRKIKEQYPALTLMVGNVANPETYKILSDAGADYIRVGIGNGGGCLTTQSTGVGYPMASLIKECYELSLTLKKPAYIVADGGMQTYSDVIKALALGADYVMLGNILNKSLESSGDNYLWKKIKVSQKVASILHNLKIPVYKKFRGMSTKEVQKKWGATELKTSEGVVRSFTNFLTSSDSFFIL